MVETRTMSQRNKKHSSRTTPQASSKSMMIMRPTTVAQRRNQKRSSSRTTLQRRNPKRRCRTMPETRKETKTMVVSSSTNATDYEDLLVFDMITDDLLVSHILPKLPAKSLRRFTCVSKFWNKTIHDPTFIASHYNHSKLNPSLVAVIQPKFLYGRSYYGASSFIVGSCNGLICTRTEFSFQILNPSTREILRFPQPPTENPGYANVSDGFGYDPLANEFKILRIIRKTCLILTLGTAGMMRNYSWRNITVTCNLPPDIHIYSRSFPLGSNILNGNGAPYWITIDHKYVSFDMHYEKFQVIPAPTDYICRRLPVCSAFQLRGCPCLVYRKELKDGREFILYSLSNDYNKWIKECKTVRIPFKLAGMVGIRIVEFWGRILLLWVCKDGHFYIYDPETRSLQKKASRSLDHQTCEKRSVFVATNHIDNLYSLKTLVPPAPSPPPPGLDEEILYMSSSDLRMDEKQPFFEVWYNGR